MASSDPELVISRYAATIRASTIAHKDKDMMLTVFCSCLCRHQYKPHEIARLMVAGAKAITSSTQAQKG